MFVYVTAGPVGKVARAFLSKTRVERFWVAWDRLGAAPSEGVCVPSVTAPEAPGVVAPELA